jgi:hypothetical protein
MLALVSSGEVPLQKVTSSGYITSTDIEIEENKEVLEQQLNKIFG